MNKVKQLTNKLLKKDKWKIYLYYKNQFVKKVYKEEDFKLDEEVFIVTIFNKKHLFGTRKAKVVMKFNKVKLYNADEKKLHCEVILYEGRETK